MGSSGTATLPLTALHTVNVLALPPAALAAGCTNLAGDGVTDDQPALQTLVTYLGGQVTATGLRQVVYAPRGTYAIKTTPGVVWRSGVSLVGDGPGLTVFKLSGSSVAGPFSAVLFDTAHQGANPQNQITDAVFRDFEVDGTGVASTIPAYNVGVKGINIQFGARLTFARLYIHGCHASGLGLDFAVDTVITDVAAVGNGRGSLTTVTDAATTTNSKTVTTAGAANNWIARPITAPGIPAGTIVTAVTVGVSATLSKFATATASGLTATVTGTGAGGAGIGVGVGGYADVNLTVADATAGGGVTVLTSAASGFTAGGSFATLGLIGRAVTGTGIAAGTTVAATPAPTVGALSLSTATTGPVSGVTITGAGSNEIMNMSVVAPTCKSNGTHGLFFEAQDFTAAYPRSKGIRVVAPHCEANTWGLSDWGADGLEVVGGHLVRNASHGFLNSSLGVSGYNGGNCGGVGGNLVGVRADDNSGDGFRFIDAYTALASVAWSYRLVGCTARGNYHGFNIENVLQTPNLRGVRIEGGTWYRNLGAGIKWSGQADQIALLYPEVKENGQDGGTQITGAGWLSGVVWDATAANAVLRGVDAYDNQGTKTQDRGLYITSNAGQPSSPTIVGCTWQNNKNGQTFLPAPPRWSGTTPYIAGNNGMDLNARNVTGNQTMLTDDVMLCVDTSGGAATVTAPPAVIPGRTYKVKKKTADANAVTFAANTGQGSVVGTASTTTQNATLGFCFDGTNWQSA